MSKRVVDIVVASVGLVVCAPLFALVALLVKLDSAGPVFFRQQRVGRGFRRFFIYKFRTMRTEAPSRARPLTVGEDPAITFLGRWLRRLKLDELPQLVNVLKGEMSLVGPRPEVPQFVEMFRREYEAILRVRPGITDPASLRYRDESAILSEAADPDEEYVSQILPHKIRLSQDYLREASLALDLRLILRTLLTMPGRRQRLTLIVAVHAVVFVLSSYLAFLLGFDGTIPPTEMRLLSGTLVGLVVVRLVVFAACGAYPRSWRTPSLWDLQVLIGAAASSTAAFYVLSSWTYLADGYPRLVFVIDTVLLILVLGGLRLVPTLARGLRQPPTTRRVLISGAGTTSAAVALGLRERASRGSRAIGFIDDDELKHRQ